jgi:hypothetical protein
MTYPGKLAAGQCRALDDLDGLSQRRADLLTVVGEPETTDSILGVQVRIRLPTGDLERRYGGLPVGEVEELILAIPPLFPLLPALVMVDHDRFAGYPHVVAGRTLCIYLDPNHEWNPNFGIIGFLNRLWDWLTTAAAAGFDPANALYHPVGGVLHHTAGTPMFVIRESIPSALSGRLFLLAGLAHRTPARIDLTGWHSGRRHLPPEVAAVVLLPGPLVFGGGANLQTLLAYITRLGAPTADQVVTELLHTTAHNPDGSPTYLLVGARATSPAPADHHLLVARIAPAISDQMREFARRRRHQLGMTAQFTAADISQPQPITLQWCPVSDERPGIATRRDQTRPASWFFGKHIEIWGCGGLGSWIAEAIVRAGAARVGLRDAGLVTSGMLVRQDYTETDVGAPKAQALAERLRAFSDRVQVDAYHDNVIGVLANGQLPACDLIIDATVNTTVALLLENAATRAARRRPFLAAVATDSPSATLGLLTMATPTWPGGPYDIERRQSPTILRNGQLEHFHIFWEDLHPDQMIIPERGCSVPTFHGAANDLMAVTGTAVDLLARRLTATTSGMDLFATAHAALPDGATRSHSRTPQASSDLQPEGPSGLRLRMSTETLARIRTAVAESEPARWMMLGDRNDTCNTVWLDDLLPRRSNAAAEDVKELIDKVAEATHGISRYLGDALILGDGHPHPAEPGDPGRRRLWRASGGPKAPSCSSYRTQMATCASNSILSIRSQSPEWVARRVHLQQVAELGRPSLTGGS